MQTTHPLSNCLFPPKLSMHSYFSHYSFIKGNFKGPLIMKNLEHRNITTQLFPPSSCPCRHALFFCSRKVTGSQIVRLSKHMVNYHGNISRYTQILQLHSTYQTKTTLCTHSAARKASTCCVIRRLHPLHTKDTRTNAHLQGLSKTQSMLG